MKLCLFNYLINGINPKHTQIGIGRQLRNVFLTETPTEELASWCYVLILLDLGNPIFLAFLLMQIGLIDKIALNK